MVKVEIEWKGEKVEVEMRSLTFGELLDISKSTTKRKMINNMIVEESDDTEMALLTLLKSIVSAPFEITRENILNMEGKWAYKLMEVANKLNSFQANKKQNVEENA